jgi:hypothetical protein
MVMDDSCGDEEEEDHSCCDNEYSQVTTDDNFTASVLDFQIPTVFVASFVLVFVLQTEAFINEEQPFFGQYQPPPLIKDIPVLYGSYLI